MLWNEFTPDPHISSSEGDKDPPDFSHFRESQLSHQDNLLSKVLFNACKNCGIWPARLEKLTEMVLVYTCECKWGVLYFQQFSKVENLNSLYFLYRIYKIRFLRSYSFKSLQYFRKKTKNI